MRPSSNALLVLILRGAVGLNCLGAAGVALNADQGIWVPGLLIAAGAWAVVCPHWVVLAGIGLWFLVEATQTAVGAMGTPWPVLLWLGQSSRYLAPLAYALILRMPPGRWDQRAEWVLRGAAAATFFGHGVRAIMSYPNFLELLDLGIGLRGAPATLVLVSIGVVDVLAAAVILARPSRAATAYMGVWGALTAGSRIVAYGLGAGWAMLLVRTVNVAVPLALLALWSRREAQSVESVRSPIPTG